MDAGSMEHCLYEVPDENQTQTVKKENAGSLENMRHVIRNESNDTSTWCLMQDAYQIPFATSQLADIEVCK